MGEPEFTPIKYDFECLLHTSMVSIQSILFFDQLITRVNIAENSDQSDSFIEFNSIWMCTRAFSAGPLIIARISKIQSNQFIGRVFCRVGEYRANVF